VASGSSTQELLPALVTDDDTFHAITVSQTAPPATSGCTWTVLSSDGTSYVVSDTFLDADGTGYTVGITVNDADGTSYVVGSCASVTPPAATGGGIGHGGKKRRRYVIKDRLYYLDEGELQQVLAIAFKPDEPVEVKKPTRRIVKKTVEKVAPKWDEVGIPYYPVPQIAPIDLRIPDGDMVRAIELYLKARRIADYERWILEDDEEIAILLAA
jgi:hypothetical protein